MSQVFSPYQLDKDTEHLPEPTGSLLCVCVCVGALYLTLSNPTNLRSTWCLIWLPSVKSHKIKSKSHSKGGPLECLRFSKCWNLYKTQKVWVHCKMHWNTDATCRGAGPKRGWEDHEWAAWCSRSTEGRRLGLSPACATGSPGDTGNSPKKCLKKGRFVGLNFELQLLSSVTLTQK